MTSKLKKILMISAAVVSVVLLSMLVYVSYELLTDTTVSKPGESPTVEWVDRNSIGVELDGDKFRVPVGQTVVIDIDKTETRGKRDFSVYEQGQSQGASIQTRSDQIASNFKSEAPVVNLGQGTSASGGSTSYDATLFSGNSSSSVVGILGALCIVGGIIWLVVIKGRVAFGTSLIIAGVSLLGIAYLSEQYPWIWLIGLLLLLGLAGWMLFDAKAKEKLETVAKHIVGGVEKSAATLRESLKKAGVPEEKLDAAVEAAQAGVKESVAKQANSDAALVKKEVTKIKEHNGFTKI